MPQGRDRPPKEMTPSTVSKPKLIAISIISGFVLTVFLTMFAFQADTREGSCIFAWQACLVQKVIHTPENDVHEATPIDLFAFMFGVALGLPIYSFLTYLALRLWPGSNPETKR